MAFTEDIFEKCTQNKNKKFKNQLPKGVLKNLEKFYGTHLCQIHFLNRVSDLNPATVLK